MKISKEDYKYLSGEKFSNGYRMALADNPLYSRIERIMMLARGKNVLHVGCCDHLELIEEKIRQNRWLHGLLEENCNEVLGIDINEEAVDYVNEKHLSREKVYCTDITSKKWKETIPERNFNMVLFGEIIEHVDNPVRFLETAKAALNDYGFHGRYVITVPNAYSFLRVSRNIKRGGGRMG